MYSWYTLKLVIISLTLIYYTHLIESNDTTNTQNTKSQDESVSEVSETQPKDSIENQSNKDDFSKTVETQNQKTCVLLSLDNEKSTNEYDFVKDQSGKLMTYTVKEGYCFNEVKWLKSWIHCMRADKNIWKSSNISNLAFKVVVKDNGSFVYDVFIYLFDNKGLYIFNRGAWGSQWKYKVGLLNPPKLEPEQIKNIPREEYPNDVIVVIKGVTEHNSSGKQTYLNYTVHKYQLKNNVLFYEYEFKEGSECVELKYEDKTVWKYDTSNSNNGYTKSCLLFLTYKTTIFSFKEDILLVSKLEGDEWKYGFHGKPKTVDIDIKNKSSGDGYNYSKNDNTNTGTFITKDNHVFDKIKYKDLIIWSTDKHYEYATKVMVEGIGSGNKKMTLYLLNGTTKIITRSAGDKPWVISGSNDTKPKDVKSGNDKLKVVSGSNGVKPSDDKSGGSLQTSNEFSSSKVKIFTKDGDNSEPSENDTSKYELNENDGNFFSYKFKENVKCIEIKYDNDSAWKFDSSGINKEHPKELYFHKRFRFFFFKVNDDSYYFFRRTKVDQTYQWISYSLKKNDLEFEEQIVVSVTEGSTPTRSKDKYDIKKLGCAFEISLKDGTKLNHLSYCNKNIRNDDNLKSKWSKLIYDHDASKHKQNKVMSIYLLENQDYILVFEKFYIVSIEDSKKRDKDKSGTDTPNTGKVSEDQNKQPEQGSENKELQLKSEDSKQSDTPVPSTPKQNTTPTNEPYPLSSDKLSSKEFKKTRESSEKLNENNENGQ